MARQIDRKFILEQVKFALFTLSAHICINNMTQILNQRIYDHPVQNFVFTTNNLKVIICYNYLVTSLAISLVL